MKFQLMKDVLQIDAEWFKYDSVSNHEIENHVEKGSKNVEKSECTSIMKDAYARISSPKDYYWQRTALKTLQKIWKRIRDSNLLPSDRR